MNHIDAVWVGMDERNAAGRKFYERVGFRGIEGAPSKMMALDFETWKGVEWARGGQTSQSERDMRQV
jgi:hypothetical protein